MKKVLFCVAMMVVTAAVFAAGFFVLAATVLCEMRACWPAAVTPTTTAYMVMTIAAVIATPFLTWRDLRKAEKSVANPS